MSVILVAATAVRNTSNRIWSRTYYMSVSDSVCVEGVRKTGTENVSYLRRVIKCRSATIQLCEGRASTIDEHSGQLGFHITAIPSTSHPR